MQYIDKKVSDALKDLTVDKKFPYKLSTEEIAKKIGTDEIYPTIHKLSIGVGRSMSRLGHFRHRTAKQVFWIITQ